MNSQIVSTIVLMRHATRSAGLDFGSVKSGDAAGESPLNAVGLAQAEDLADLVRSKGKLPAPTRLFSSPKLRARQTLEPLSKTTGLALEILEDLDERRDREALKDFTERVRGIPSLLKGGGTIYLCTHLDVLEAAALAWPTDFSEHESTKSWSTLEYQVFKVKNGFLESGARGRIEPRP